MEYWKVGVLMSETRMLPEPHKYAVCAPEDMPLKDFYKRIACSTAERTLKVKSSLMMSILVINLGQWKLRENDFLKILYEENLSEKKNMLHFFINYWNAYFYELFLCFC